MCALCGERLFSPHLKSEADPLCGLCQRAKPPFTKAAAYGAYDGELRDLIHIFKYHQVKSAGPVLADFLAQTAAKMAMPGALMVVPVPLFKGKLRSRGFNQAEEIARAYVRRQPTAGIQLETSALVRTRDTASQTGLTRKQRRLNLRGAFAVTDPLKVAGKNVLLVDDVMTTGTTAAECARVLLRAGVKQVFVATVARATKEVDNLDHVDSETGWGGTQGHA
jgi:ComF family protein